jgi:hypothetical protein
MTVKLHRGEDSAAAFSTATMELDSFEAQGTGRMQQVPDCSFVERLVLLRKDFLLDFRR